MFPLKMDTFYCPLATPPCRECAPSNAPPTGLKLVPVHPHKMPWGMPCKRPKKGGMYGPAHALELTTSLRGDSVCLPHKQLLQLSHHYAFLTWYRVAGKVYGFYSCSAVMGVNPWGWQEAVWVPKSVRICGASKTGRGSPTTPPRGCLTLMTNNDTRVYGQCSGLWGGLPDMVESRPIPKWSQLNSGPFNSTQL